MSSLEGERDKLRLGLKRLGRFQGSGYRNIMIGDVPDPLAFLPLVRDAFATDPLLQRSLGKLVPMDQVVPFAIDTAVETITIAALALAERVGSGSFFVRMERRGFRHLLHTAETERLVGERIVASLQARGHTPVVRFKDPDYVLMIETVGEEAGLALIPRALRTDFPFVRVK